MTNVKKIKSIKAVGKRDVYDISVDQVEHYVLENNVITHNTGTMLAAENVYILGRQQEKDGTELVGYNFIINIEKSRYVKDKIKIPVLVRREGGIARYGGLFDIAIDGGFLVKVNNRSYAHVDTKTGEIITEKLNRKDTENNSEFWKKLLSTAEFKDYVRKTYAVSSGELIREDDDVDDLLEHQEDSTIIGENID